MKIDRFTPVILGVCLFYYFFFGPKTSEPISKSEVPPPTEVSVSTPNPDNLFWTRILYVGAFVITVVFGNSLISRNIGIKNTRRQALNHTYDVIKENEEKLTGATKITDEGGSFDKFTTIDRFGSQKSYYIQSTEDLNKIDPEDFKTD